MMYHRLFAGLTVAAFLLSSRAEADPSEADRRAARALAAQAHNAVDKKDYSAAADLFGRAHAIVPVPTMLLGLARARAELGKLVEAREAYNQIIREGVPPNGPKPFFEALDLARQEVAALNLRIAWVKMTVTGAAKVWLDGVEVPSASIGSPQAVNPGKHVLTATGDGGARAKATVTLGEGTTETVTLDLKPAAAEPTPPVGPAPAEKRNVAPDRPRRPLVAGVPPVPASKGSARKTAGFVSLGVGAAGLVLGGVTGALVLNRHGALDEECEDGICPDWMQPKLDSYNTLGLVSTLGFIAGGAVAGLGVVLLVTAPTNKEATVGLMMGPTSGGGVLSAAGRF
jgi:hypothetical protein